MLRSYFALFWSLQPSAQDWQNLTVSRVRRLLLPYSLAMHDPALCQELSRREYTYIVRLLGEDYDVGRQWICAQNLADLRVLAPGMEAVILGNEPDHGYIWRYGSLDWGHEAAQRHAYTMSAMRRALERVPVPAISAAWTMRGHSMGEAGGDLPLPGMISWREHTNYAYTACDGNAAHFYAHDWITQGDGRNAGMERFVRWLAWQQTLHHKPLWLDEVGINSGTQVERMRGYIQMADFLTRGRLGERVELFCPFISVGDPGEPDPAWDRRYLITDPRCYELLGEFMEGHS